MRILKGNKVRLVLISVSTDCWAKKPHRMAIAIQNRVVFAFILIKITSESLELSTAGIYPMSDITTENEASWEKDYIFERHNFYSSFLANLVADSS